MLLTSRCFLLDLCKIPVAQIGASYRTEVAPVTQIQTSCGLNADFILFQHEFLRRTDARSRLHGSCPPAARMRTSCRVHAGSLAACMGSTWPERFGRVRSQNWSPTMGSLSCQAPFAKSYIPDHHRSANDSVRCQGSYNSSISQSRFFFSCLLEAFSTTVGLRLVWRAPRVAIIASRCVPLC